MSDVVKVGWSGGKDSSCAVMKHIERGDKVKAVNYIPMFTREIPLITKRHYEFIMNTANKFRSMGAEVFNADRGITYYDYVTHVAVKGKYKGLIFGFPTLGRGQCGFKRDGKLKALSLCDVGYYDYEGVGIAFDETARHAQLNDKLRSVLCELKLTTPEIISFCKLNNVYSPHYSSNKRDGCALCYNATWQGRKEWFKDYPEAVPLVIELQNIVKAQRPDRPPLRGYKYFIEESEV